MQRDDVDDDDDSPHKTPEEPNPAIALPMMKAVEFGAAPQTREPSSKQPMEERKMILGE